MPLFDAVLYTLAHVIAATLTAKTSLRTGKLCRTVYQLLLGGLPSLDVKPEVIFGRILFLILPVMFLWFRTLGGDS